MEQSNQHSPKSELIQKMFGRVAPCYDRANQILSFGVHHLWRTRVVSWTQAQPYAKILDCATGTGDLAIAYQQHLGPSAQVIGTDFCVEMLGPAPEKAKKAGLNIRFETADVTNLPYPNATFDVVSISFGIRNVENPVRGIQEMARVLKPGGVLMILEFGQPTWPLFSSAYDFYSTRVLPKIGGWITGQTSAYEYLQKSSAVFPSGEEFVKLLRSAHGFQKIEFQSLTGGIAYIYKAVK